MKIIKRAGPRIGDLLFNKTPWSKEHCSRQDCLPCQTKPGGCRVPNIAYKLKCLEYQKSGVRSHYVGESHGIFYDRAREHFTALKNKNKTYSVVKHWVDHHPDLKSPPQFSYHLIGKHMSAVERQIKECLIIEKESRLVDNLFNGKGELGMNVVPRLQSEKDGLGICKENPPITSIGKRQAELATDEPRSNSTHTQIDHNVPG